MRTSPARARVETKSAAARWRRFNGGFPLHVSKIYSLARRRDDGAASATAWRIPRLTQANLLSAGNPPCKVYYNNNNNSNNHYRGLDGETPSTPDAPRAELCHHRGGFKQLLAVLLAILAHSNMEHRS